jgi:hypothetical protein
MTNLLPATITRPISQWRHLTPAQRQMMSLMDLASGAVKPNTPSDVEVLASLWAIGVADAIYTDGEPRYALTRRGDALLETQHGGEVCPVCHGWQYGWGDAPMETQPDDPLWHGASSSLGKRRWHCPHCDGGVKLPRLDRMRRICGRFYWRLTADQLAAVPEAELVHRLQSVGSHALTRAEKVWLAGIGVRPAPQLITRPMQENAAAHQRWQREAGATPTMPTSGQGRRDVPGFGRYAAVTK